MFLIPLFPYPFVSRQPHILLGFPSAQSVAGIQLTHAVHQDTGLLLSCVFPEASGEHCEIMEAQLHSYGFQVGGEKDVASASTFTSVSSWAALPHYKTTLAYPGCSAIILPWCQVMHHVLVVLGLASQSKSNKDGNNVIASYGRSISVRGGPCEMLLWRTDFKKCCHDYMTFVALIYISFMGPLALRSISCSSY